LIENLSYHYEIASWEEKQKLLKILFPDKLIFKNGQFTNPSGEGIRLLVENIRQYEKQGIPNDPSVNELKAMKKIRRVG
jgi:hypothetical protein